MSQRINLLNKRPDFLKVESYFHIFRIITYISVVLFLVLVSLFFFINLNEEKKLNNILKEKQTYLSYFVKNNDKEAEFAFFTKKDKQLQDFLKEDTRIVLQPYYKMLSETLQTASDASLLGVKINTDKSIEFSVGFANFESLNHFGDFIESPGFLDKFSELVMNSFSAFAKDKNDYKLGFSGKLKEINETKN